MLSVVFRSCLLLLTLLVVGCQPASDTVRPSPTDASPPPVVLPAGLSLMGSCFGEGNARLVLAQSTTGQRYALLYPFGPTTDIPPVQVDGAFSHCRQHIVERDDGKDLERWVLVTASGTPDLPRTITHVLTPKSSRNGTVALDRLIRIMKRGAFSGERASPDRHLALILYSRPVGNRAMLLNLAAVREIEDTEYDAAPADFRDVAFVNGWRVEASRHAAGQQVLIATSGNGSRRAETMLPGTFVAMLPGRTKLMVVTRRADGLHHDMFDLSGRIVTPPSPAGARGLTGRFDGMAHVVAADSDRFVLTTSDMQNKRTQFRVVDGTNAIIDTVTYAGRFERAVHIRVATTTAGRPALLTRLAAALQTDGSVDGVILDLLSGEQVSGMRVPGVFRHLSANPAGAATLKTSDTTVVIPGE